ncbi:hypothetical protein GCM10028807_15570 [Spirosoma daeguense]
MEKSNNCLICNAPAEPYCKALVLGTYDVQYFRCTQCGFIQTETPYWLDHAYDSAITKLDIGLVLRNELTAPVVQAVINRWFNQKGKFIDYGGGYGMLVRMLRDRGFDYYRQDIHCENLFAKSFDITDTQPFKAELLTAFEVFEHLTDPVAELTKMLTLSDSILFSTNVQPHSNVKPENWWYFTPETGQHIALYSRESLQKLADKFQLHYNWNNHDIHLFSRKKISNWEFRLIADFRLSKWYNKLAHKNQPLLQSDFSVIRQKLNETLANNKES